MPEPTQDQIDQWFNAIYEGMSVAGLWLEVIREIFAAGVEAAQTEATT